MSEATRRARAVEPQKHDSKAHRIPCAHLLSFDGTSEADPMTPCLSAHLPMIDSSILSFSGLMASGSGWLFMRPFNIPTIIQLILNFIGLLVTFCRLSQ